MDDPFSPERKTVRLNKQNLFGSGYAGLGYLITMFNARLAVHKGYEETLRGMYGQSVFETVIPIITDFKEAIMQRKPVALFKPKGSGAKTMKALASELDRRIQGASRDQVRGAA